MQTKNSLFFSIKNYIKEWYKQADGWDFVRIVIAIPTIPFGIMVFFYWILRLINLLFGVNL